MTSSIRGQTLSGALGTALPEDVTSEISLTILAKLEEGESWVGASESGTICRRKLSVLGKDIRMCKGPEARGVCWVFGLEKGFQGDLKRRESLNKTKQVPGEEVISPESQRRLLHC